MPTTRPAIQAGNARNGLSRFWDLLLNLTWRDVRVRYKQSLLGIGWAVLLPLSMMLVFTFVFTRAVQVQAVAEIPIPYALYAYIGLAPWTFFSNGLSAALISLVANRNLITKVYCPREVFPLSAIAASLFDFCIAMLVLGLLIAYFHWNGTFSFALHASVLLVPLVLMVQIVLMIGLGMMLAAANLFYRDVRPVFNVCIQLWMFLSAVVVPVPQDGSLLNKWIGMNPMVPIISGYRECIVYGQAPHMADLGYAAVVAAGALVLGWSLFRQSSWKFAECI